MSYPEDSDENVVRESGPIRNALNNALEEMVKLSSLNEELERHITSVLVSPRDTVSMDKQKIELDREPSELLNRVNHIIDKIRYCSIQVSDLISRLDL